MVLAVFADIDLRAFKIKYMVGGKSVVAMASRWLLLEGFGPSNTMQPATTTDTDTPSDPKKPATSVDNFGPETGSLATTTAVIFTTTCDGKTTCCPATHTCITPRGGAEKMCVGKDDKIAVSVTCLMPTTNATSDQKTELNQSKLNAA